MVSWHAVTLAAKFRLRSVKIFLPCPASEVATNMRQMCLAAARDATLPAPRMKPCQPDRELDRSTWPRRAQGLTYVGLELRGPDTVHNLPKLVQMVTCL